VAKMEETLKKVKQQSERRQVPKANPFGASESRDREMRSSEDAGLRKGPTEAKSPAARTTKLLG